MVAGSNEETGYFHVTARSAGCIALFEDDADRRSYLRMMREARDDASVRIVAWVLMTDHIHLVIDCKEDSGSLSRFMYLLQKRYVRYFNSKTGRTGHLFQDRFWRKPIKTDNQLIATVHYIHMNPEAAGLAPMRDYRWSSYQEYAGKHWVVDASMVLGIFGSFAAFDAYGGSMKDVVRQHETAENRDEVALALAMELAGCATSAELRNLPVAERNRVMLLLHADGASARSIARTFGIGVSTVARIVKGN